MREALKSGTIWRRRRDGRRYEVVWYYQGYKDWSTGFTRPPSVQFRPEGQTGNRTTNWVLLENLERLYEPVP